MQRSRWSHTASLGAAVQLLVLALAPAVAAHSGTTVGPYELELGWRAEPAVVGKANAVQVAVAEHESGQPVADLAPGDLVVTVSTVGRDSTTLSLAPASRASSQGTYEAAFVPPAAGDYSFHVTGSIHGTAVDVVLESTVDSTDAQSEAGPDPLLLAVGGVIILLLAGMAYLLFRVRPASAPPGP
jgi:hypothetical protein